MKLLNIGAGPAGIAAPPWYHDWKVVRLDIDPDIKPDILLDVLELDTLEARQFDAVYASHLLEHIYPFDLSRFLSGVLHVLKRDGFAEFRLPNALDACKRVVEEGSIDAFCYASSGGDVTAWDMLYGHRLYQEHFGAQHAHHNAFDPQRLSDLLTKYFRMVYVQKGGWELHAVACRRGLSDTMKERLNLV